MKDILLCAWRELSRRKGRSAFQMMAYFFAIIFFTIMGNVLVFSNLETAKILHNVGTHLLLFIPVSQKGDSTFPDRTLLDSKNEAFYADPMVVTHLLPNSMIARIESFPSVLRASPLLLFRMKNPNDGTLFSVAGFDPANPVVIDSNLSSQKDIIAGAFLQSGDRGLAVVEESFAVSYDLKIGSNIAISGISFPVIGIVRPGIRPAKADVYLIREDAVEVMSRRLEKPLKDEFNIALIEVRNVSLQDEAIIHIKKEVSGAILNSFHCYVGASKVMGMSEFVAAVLLCLVFAGTTCFSMVSQWGSVMERRRDIGILKALGWTPKVIIGQIMAESFFCSTFGGTFGVITGWVILALLPVKEMTNRPFEWRLEIIVALAFCGIILSIFTGLFAAAFPAIFASRENPADALRKI
ncbi:MAG: ABC transporter permease [Candidatus Ozemobacteraceae bacterium]